jgi:ABC-type branched-subunit amino acid transport system substrate-binding protein
MGETVMAEQASRPQARRGALVLAAGLLLGFGLSGCALVPAPRVEAPPAQASPPPEPVRAAPAPQAYPTLPQPSADLPDDADRGRVALLVPLSGPNAAVGQSIANAANLALLDTGAHRIRLTVYDTARAGAGAAANEALAAGTGMFLGPLLADDVRAVSAIARRANVPVVSFSNDVGVAGDGVYLIGFTPGESVARVVSYARSQGLTRFAALTPAAIFGQRVSQAMVAATQRSAARLVGMESFGADPASLRTAVERVGGRGGYDAILIAESSRTAALAVPYVRSGVSPAARILGTEVWANDPALGSVPALRGAWFAAISDTLFNQMRTRYRARYRSDPHRLAGLGYDAVLLAVRAAREWRAGWPFPQRALHDPAGFLGIDGPFRFGAGNVAEHALEVREVTASGTVVVSPAPRPID